MNQIIHIFRKDTRLCWLEILLSLASLAVMVCIYPLRWSALPARSFNTVSALNMNTAVLCTGLSALVVVSWVVLVGRIIHAEGLVGKTHFWLTRPYEWQSLLAAKLLFLAVYIYLPLVTAQWLLLVIAGLNSFSVLPGLLFNLLLITGCLVLPMMAIAAITANISRMVFALLCAVLLGFAAMAAFSMPGYSFRQSNILISLAFLAVNNLAAPAHSLTSLGHHSQLLFALLLATVCGVIVILQYAKRKTRICWLILLVLPVVIATGAMAKAHYALSGQALIDHDYAMVSGSAAPIELSSASIRITCSQ